MVHFLRLTDFAAFEIPDDPWKLASREDRSIHVSNKSGKGS